jgi:GlpG protein
MRQIGNIPNAELAEQFADFLRGQGTACSLDADGGGWAVWVHDEDRVSAARQELQSFLTDPSHERYRDARRQADERLRAEYERRKAARRNTISVRSHWERSLVDRCPLTIGLLAVCAVVAIFTRLGGHFLMPGERAADFLPLQRELWISPDGRWNAIFSGQVWRVWTPMFLHYGWLHILFNALWLKEFGTLLEDRLGTLRFLLLVLAVGATAHLAEFAIAGHYRMGGMSGVNYGLFGYLWVRGKLDPTSGLGVSSQTVLWMGLWFLACFTGIVGPVANMAHAGGLAAGVSLGALAALRVR